MRRTSCASYLMGRRRTDWKGRPLLSRSVLSPRRLASTRRAPRSFRWIGNRNVCLSASSEHWGRRFSVNVFGFSYLRSVASSVIPSADSNNGSLLPLWLPFLAFFVVPTISLSRHHLVSSRFRISWRIVSWGLINHKLILRNCIHSMFATCFSTNIQRVDLAISLAKPPFACTP